jgi:chromosome transmission fidelity protein 18
MEKTLDATVWFCFNDCIQHKINQLQNYSIYPYLQYAFASWHFSFASMAYPQITYPQKQFEMSNNLTTIKHIFNAFKKGMTSSTNSIGCKSELLTDTMTFLKIIIFPEIRAVSMHLLTEKEKKDLQHTVNIIADIGLTFIQFQSADGNFAYRLEPDLDQFHFTGIPSRQISYGSKQIISREVEIEKLRRVRPKASNDDSIMNESVDEKNVKDDKRATPLNHLQKLVPKSIKQVKTIQKDFFGRIINANEKVTLSEKSLNNEKHNDDHNVLVKSPLWFKFKEGFNNAVRTDVKYSDLL